MVNSQSMYPGYQLLTPARVLDTDGLLTRIVDRSVEVDHTGVGTSVFSSDIDDAESSRHGEVRDHSDGQNKGREPGHQRGCL